MTAALIPEVRCDRCGRATSGDDFVSTDDLRTTLHSLGWASEVGGYDDACTNCCEVIVEAPTGAF